MKNAVIFGAGQTGRGFIAPILQSNDYHVTFVDKDSALIDQINEEKEYTIRYFGNCKKPITIKDFEAYTNEDPQAVEKLVEADVICTSVFAGHLKELIPLLQTVEKSRTSKMQIICCENGVNVKKDLVESGLNAIITEGIIFCTTLKPDSKSLDLLCEDIEEIPIDAKVEGLNLHIKRMPLEERFSDLIQRKIYTYNFMSAIIAYLGWYKGYEVYGDAGNDSQIDHVIQTLKPLVSRVIAREFNITYEEQLAFTQRAVNKFQNREIIDTIYRNARQAKRKLGIKERILSPMRMTVAQGEDYTWFKLIVGAAMTYAHKVEGEDLKEVYVDLSSFLPDNDIKNIQKIQDMMEKGESLDKVFAIL